MILRQIGKNKPKVRRILGTVFRLLQKQYRDCQSVRLRREAVTLTRELIARDGATIRDLLDADPSVATANILLSRNLRQLGRYFVILNVSLGSGNGHAGTVAAQ